MPMNFVKALLPALVSTALIELLLEIPQTRITKDSLAYWVKLFQRGQLKASPGLNTSDARRAMLDFSIVFGLSRDDRRRVIRGSELKAWLDAARRLNIEIDNTTLLHGAFIRRARGYPAVAARKAQEISECYSISPYERFIYAVMRRSVGYRIGRAEEAVARRGLSIVLTDEWALQEDGAIWTYSLQSCVAVAAVGPVGMFLLHSKTKRKSLISEIQDGLNFLRGRCWTKVFIFAQPDYNYQALSLENVEVERVNNTPGSIVSVGIERKDGEFKILRETHLKGVAPFPFGITQIAPVGECQVVAQVPFAHR